MLKLGIFRPEDYYPQPHGVLEKLRSFLTLNRPSYQLLRTNIPASPREISLFESITWLMKLDSGVYRSTFGGRFKDLDQFTGALMKGRFARESSLEIHDWAASDCLTSAEWTASLLELFPNARVHASDLTLFLIEARLASGEAFIQEAGCEPLQYLRRPFVIRMNPPEPRSLPVNRLVFYYARAKFARVKPKLTAPADWLASNQEELRLPSCTLRKIPLIHPAAEALRLREPRFSIQRHSAFTSLSEPVDVIRTMNIFNLAYFETERLAEGVRAVWASLKPGGWWIVGRTTLETPPVHNVSLLEKQTDGFRLVERYGEGSEIEALALAGAWMRQTRVSLDQTDHRG